MWFGFAWAAELKALPMDEKELQKRIDEYGSMILRIAFAYLRDRQRAEDICQEIFVKLWSAGDSFQSKEHERAWVIRASVNLCKDYAKSAWAKRTVLENEWREETAPEQEPSMAAEKKEEAKKLFQMVSELEDAFKSVLILYYYEDLSSKEIAHALGIPEATVRSRLKRGRDKLQKRLMGKE